MRPTRPVLRYHGGKWRMAKDIVATFPPHRVYVEPFGGAASVLLSKPPAEIEVYNDVDDCVVGLFRVLRDEAKADALRRAVELTPFSRSEFAACWERSADEVEDARRLIVRSFQCIGNNNIDRPSGWRTRTATCRWSPCVSWHGWPTQIPAFVMRFKQTIVESLDWAKALTVYDSPETLFYVDPPYPLQTRKSGYRKMYANELSADDHSRLLTALQSVQGHVVLSGYPCPQYDAVLSHWETRDFNARAQTNAKRIERLWLSPSVSAWHKRGRLELDEEIPA